MFFVFFKKTIKFAEITQKKGATYVRTDNVLLAKVLLFCMAGIFFKEND